MPECPDRGGFKHCGRDCRYHPVGNMYFGLFDRIANSYYDFHLSSPKNTAGNRSGGSRCRRTTTSLCKRKPKDALGTCAFDLVLYCLGAMIICVMYYQISMYVVETADR